MRSHRHAHFQRRGIDGFHVRALLEEHLRLRRVGRHHAVAHKAVAIANQHGLLADELAHGHAGGERPVAGLCGADVLQELHDVGRGEEVAAHDAGRVLQHRGDLVDVQAAGVRPEEGVRPAVLLQVAEDLLLELHDLGHGLNDRIDVRQVLVTDRRLDEPHEPLEIRLRDLALLSLRLPQRPDLLHAVVEPLLLRVLEDHGDALLREAHRDAPAHQPSAQDADLLQRRRGCRDAGDLGCGPLREEQVPQCL
mmetsp:Transcript_47463/g.141734  ORF Transcript_47463/g.141734 Transcript_47463/m.141734 type:complete len:251 (+) Transcript_47463:742-1494(+)